MLLYNHRKGTEVNEDEKYNLSNIMKRAWEMVKNMGMTISEGLKKAWREAKMKKELIGTPKQVAWAQDIIDDAMNTINANIKRASETDDMKKLLGFDSWLEIKEQVMSLIFSTKEAKTFIEHRNVIDPERIIKIHDEMEMKKRM